MGINRRTASTVLILIDQKRSSTNRCIFATMPVWSGVGGGSGRKAQHVVAQGGQSQRSRECAPDDKLRVPTRSPSKRGGHGATRLCPPHEAAANRLFLAVR